MSLNRKSSITSATAQDHWSGPRTKDSVAQSLQKNKKHLHDTCGLLFLPVTCLVRHNDFHNDPYVKVNVRPVPIQHCRICCSYVHTHEPLICTDAEMRFSHGNCFISRQMLPVADFSSAQASSRCACKDANVLYSETLIEANMPPFIHTENVRTFLLVGKESMLNTNKGAEMTLSAIQTSVSVRPQSVSSKETQQTVRLVCLNVM